MTVGSARIYVALSTIAVLGFCLTVRGYSWFIADDYTGFWLAGTRPLADFLMTRIDVHFLPLHRLATWLIYTCFPMNFEVALFVMSAFYVASIWILWHTLDLIHRSPINGPLSVLCGSNYYGAILL